MNELKVKEREETKYILSYHQYQMLLQLLKNKYSVNTYHVRSNYYDTQNKDFLYQKLDGNFQKIKLRHRIYNLKESFFEAKVKNGKVNYKQRFYNLPQTWNYIQTVSKQKLGTLILYPIIQVDYDRTAVDIDQDLRITLDSNILYKNLITNKIHQENHICILEIKTFMIPSWLKLTLHRMNINESRFSKYQEGYENTI